MEGVREKSDNKLDKPDGEATLKFLIRRITQSPGLPSFSKHIIEINEKTSLAGKDSVSASELANVILRDYSLTNKVLRVVNSAYYGLAAGKITTVTRAVVMLGFEQIRLIASSTLVFEHLKTEAHQGQLKDEIISSVMSGFLAREIGQLTGMVNLEEAFICSMFQNLGKILVIFYLPEEFDKIESYKARKEVGDRAASEAILGISYSELGRGVAQAWKFPDKITAAIREEPEGEPTPIKSEQDALVNISLLANKLCKAIKETESTEVDSEIERLLDNYSKCFSFSKNQLQVAIEKSANNFSRFSEHLDLPARDSALIEKLTPSAPKATDEQREEKEIEIPSDLPVQDDEMEPTALLIAGIKDVSSILLGKYGRRDLLTAILETLYRGYRFYRVIFFLKHKDMMIGCLGFGPDIDETIPSFSFKTRNPEDVFTLALSAGKDIRIDDSRSPQIARRIPSWYKDTLFAPSFVLFPVTIGEDTVGLLYADREKAGGVIEDAHVDYIRALRNLAGVVLSPEFALR